ncbi:hypothetical protein KKG05_00395 [bacterium]|nr:hypothetical protein [bacterium]
MSFIQEIINGITGNLATDVVRWMAFKTGNTKLIRRFENRLNPEQLHPATRALLEEVLAEGLGDLSEIDSTGWKEVFEHSDNRLQLIDWVLEWQEKAKPELGEWSLENAPNVELLRGFLERLHGIIQKKKQKHFPPYFFNLLGNQIAMLEAMGDLSQQLDDGLAGINALLTMPVSEKELPPKLLLTLPPLPYFVHSLDLAEHFTGRIEERGELTKWMNRQGDIGNKSVLVLRAIGGMGKSSVAWIWVRRDVVGISIPGLKEDIPEVQSKLRVPEDKQPEGILWYSFYEGGGTFKDFLEKVIAYCSIGERTIKDYTTETKAGPSIDYGTMQEDVIQLLQRRRFLLVWDGAERLLREYACVDAAMREERELEELEPSARDIVDRSTERFLKDIAAQSSSQVLLTSRLYPLALEKPAGAGELELKGLGKDYSVDYLRAQGIRGNRDELESAAEQYGFHPLSLSMLVADLRKDFEDEGDIKAAFRHDETEKVKARQYHILERAYNSRAPHRQKLLSRMAAMRGTIPKEVVRLLAEDIDGLERENLGQDLDELVRHGLLRHPSPDKYDFHPIVRRYCYQRLDEREAIHRRLMSYYKAIRPPEKMTRLEDLAPTIELYHHTVRAGLYDDARTLFRDRLSKPLYFQFGTYQTIIELLRALFPDDEDKLPRLKDMSAQGWTLNDIASSYAFSGLSHRAVQAFALQHISKIVDS